MGTQTTEWLKCSRSFPYFIDQYVKIYDAISRDWIPFKLWPMQVDAADSVAANRLVLVLKARQLGITWMCLAYLLWMMIFKAAATVMLFSRRETEAGYLMTRLRGIYTHLPDFLKARTVNTNNTLTFSLSNGSIAYAFPTTAGDSYTASAVLVDEADLIPNLDSLMAAVKPTIDAGGKMIMVSRSDKENPMSPFKNLFKGAMAGKNPWSWVFLPWYSRPDRTQEWYNEIVADVTTRTGSMDEVYEQYPATPEEAMQAISLDKRFNSKFLDKVYVPMTPISKGDIPGLVIYKYASLVGKYRIGADPAEGNPKSDDSVATVMDMNNGEEMAVLAGKIEPTIFSTYLEELSRMYLNAKVLPERNNHGHVVLGVLPPSLVVKGLDEKPGWHTNIKSKAHMYSHAVKVVNGRRCIIHSPTTMEQLLSIEGDTLKAPKEMLDDYATSYALCTLGIDVSEERPFAVNYKNVMFAPRRDPRRVRLGLV